MYLLIVLLTLIAFSVLFLSTGTAYFSVNMIHLKQMAENGDKHARTAYSTSRNFTAAITTILTGNNVANTLAVPIATELLTQMFGSADVAVATGIMAILTPTSREITPKIVVKAKAGSVALSMMKPLPIIVLLFRPISFVVGSIGAHWEKEMEIENVTATENELLGVVSTIEQGEVLEQGERELIESAIEFNDKDVRDIMILKDQVAFLYDNIICEQMKQVLHNHKLSRLPMISYQTTGVVGVLCVRDVLDALLEDKKIVIPEMMQEPIFVTQRKKLSAVLEDIQRSREHTAIAEESLTSHVFVGTITLEDVLEELIGEIYDEYDPLPNHVVEIGHHTSTIDENVSLVDFFDTYAEDQGAPKTKARTFAAWTSGLDNHRKVHKGRGIEPENLEIKVPDIKDGMAARTEMQILSQMDDDLNQKEHYEHISKNSKVCKRIKGAGTLLSGSEAERLCLPERTDSLKPENRRGRRNDNRRTDSPGHEEYQGCSRGHGV